MKLHPISVITSVAIAAASFGGAFVGRSQADPVTETGSMQLQTTAATSSANGAEPRPLGVLEPMTAEQAAQPVADDDPTLGLSPIVGAVTEAPSAQPLDAPTGDGPAFVELAPDEPAPYADGIEGDLTGIDADELAFELRAAGLDPAIAGATDAGATSGTESLPSGDDLGITVVDPCAPVDGVGPADCPDGARSTVLAIVAPPTDLYIFVNPYYDSGPAVTDSCPARRAERGELFAYVESTAPLTELTVEIWTPFGEVASRKVGEATMATAASDQARWEGFAASADPTIADLAIVHCMVIGGLEPTTQYIVRGRAVDVYGRTDAENKYVFSEPERNPPPDVIVAPFGTSQVLVVLPHLGSEVPDIRAWSAADPSEGCNSEVRRAYLPRYYGRTTIDPDTLERRGRDPRYTGQALAIFEVQEGTTTIVCTRVFAGAGPTFSRLLRQQRALVRAPDMVSAVVTVESVGSAARIDPSLFVVNLDQGGDRCGVVQANVGPGEPPAVIIDEDCDALPSSRRPVVVTTSVVRGGATVSTSEPFVINVRPRRCTGGDPDGGLLGSCPNLPSEYYRVPFPLVPIQGGTCTVGLFESACEPPRRDQLAGSALIRVDWVGSGPGQAGWTVEPVAPEAVERPSGPQLDDSPGWFTTSFDGGTPVLEGMLRADRNVLWDLTLADAGCGRGAASATSDGATNTFRFRLEGLCATYWYRPTVTLTDPATGEVTRWAREPRLGETYWENGVVEIPGLTRPVLFDLRVIPPDISVWKIDEALLYLGTPGRPYRGEHLNVGYGASGDCVVTRPTGDVPLGFTRSRTLEYELPDTVEIRLSIVLLAMDGSRDRCVPQGIYDERRVELTATVSLDDLLDGEVVLRAPLAGPFEAALRINTIGG